MARRKKQPPPPMPLPAASRAPVPTNTAPPSYHHITEPEVIAYTGMFALLGVFIVIVILQAVGVDVPGAPNVFETASQSAQPDLYSYAKRGAGEGMRIAVVIIIVFIVVFGLGYLFSLASPDRYKEAKSLASHYAGRLYTRSNTKEPEPQETVLVDDEPPPSKRWNPFRRNPNKKEKVD